MRTSWNMLPFESQPINNFSSYDISQSVDWECPFLSPYVLLVWIFLKTLQHKRCLLSFRRGQLAVDCASL